MQTEIIQRRGWLRTLVRSLVAIVLVVAVLAAGVYWHEPLARLAGRSHTDASPAATATAPAAGKQLWTCGMHPQVIQDKPGDCPICHMKLTPLELDADSGGGAVKERKIAYYWDPMIGPDSISDKPGKSTMNMDLVPVYEDAVSGGSGVRIDPVVVQNMGVRVATVTRGLLPRTIRAVGYLAEAQPLIHDVNLRVSGWIEKLYVDVEGQHVERGAPLFDLYSPEVQVAVQELIAARGGAATAAGDDLAADTTRTLLQSARAKLAQWGLSDARIDALAKLDAPPRAVTFDSPATGDVTMKNVVAGANVAAGNQVMRIVDRSTLWLDVQVYEQDYPLVRLGQSVTATVDAVPGETFAGKIIFIHPLVDPTTRTVRVRIELPNADLRLRPGMYATATILGTLADDAVLVPREAVIDTGTRAITFISAGDGRFEPRELKLGVGGGGVVQVLAGLAPGETVVTSGQFLLDAESRMKEAIQRHLDQGLASKRPAAGDRKDVLGDTSDLPANAQGMPGMENMNGMNEMPAATRAAAAGGSLAWSPDVDALYRAYLDLLAQFTADGRAEPVDARPLVDAADRLVKATAGPLAALPTNVRDAAAALAGQPLKEQRKTLKALSAAVVKMVETCPPSKAIGADQLVVIRCPMVNADWLQTSDDVLNPYMPTMRTCGEVKNIISATPGGTP